MADENKTPIEEAAELVEEAIKACAFVEPPDVALVIADRMIFITDGAVLMSLSPSRDPVAGCNAWAVTWGDARQPLQVSTLHVCVREILHRILDQRIGFGELMARFNRMSIRDLLSVPLS